ncbi:TetR/AcrR family transcriptional regulator [Vibrio marisflavi]|uniref:HTH-type transcriptional repressor NemR n=1 Tax=Vibrio marisflavi CECT 7928 TaxID=634439 RepID=A0ABM8ZZF8_9VIBR|nr:TetR/AcrR family transcriptional regulator [Vibrio marisflavi]CAH0536461.1 HTH-type transcriptional repressor NemR [Vibrio marisflavi CECT 7928]
MNKKTADTRQHILDVGYQLVVSKGFTSVGLSELLKNAAVPKGSFYHYFKSKEQFGEALIQDYFDSYMQRLALTLSPDNGNSLQQILHYFSGWLEVVDGVCNAHKCLVVKLSAEVSDLSDPMREALNSGANKIVASIAKCIEKGIERDEIIKQDSLLIARTLYQLWLGGSLLSKLNNDIQQLEQTMKTTKQLLVPAA